MSNEKLGGKIWKFRRLCLPVTLMSCPIWTSPNRIQCHLHWSLWKLNTLLFSNSEWLRGQVSQNPPAAQIMSPKTHRSLSWPMALQTTRTLLSAQLECASPGWRYGQSGKYQWLQCVRLTFQLYFSVHTRRSMTPDFHKPRIFREFLFLGCLCLILLIISYLSFKSQPPLLGW